MESFKLLSSDKKDNFKKKLISMIVENLNISRDLLDHTQRQLADNLKCDG